MRKWCSGMGLVAFVAAPAFAQQAAAPIIGVTVADSGDTAWLMVAALLTLIMAIPGIALFFSGQVATKHVHATLTQALAIAAAVSLAWVAIGYSLAFGEGTTLLGSTDNAFLANLAELRTDTTVPESSFALYQMMPAIIAALLLIGAAADRVRFGWLLSFAVLWALCVYMPVAHWLLGNGWLAALGAHDFAGGIVVDVAAGVSALVIALMVGPRRALEPGAAPIGGSALTILGGGLIWVGWLAFIGGAALSASDDASAAIINAHVSACAAALVWALIERLRGGTASVTGLIRGAIAGLAAASASAGYIGPMGALVLGAIAGVASALTVALIKTQAAIDDGASVFAVFGISGIVGALLFPIFVPNLGGPGFEQGVTMTNQLLAQGIAIGAVAVWAIVVTLVMGLGITLVIPMRLTPAEEAHADGNNDVTMGI